MTLKKRFYFTLVCLTGFSLLGALVMIWYTYRMEALLTGITEEGLAAFKAAGDLETALVNQKGFVTYYLLDDDPTWLRQLGQHRQIFIDRLVEARRLAQSPSLQEGIERIEDEYRRYVESKDKVIAYYRSGQREAGARLHREVRQHFFAIIDLCEDYKRQHGEKIASLTAAAGKEAFRLRIIAAVTIFLCLGFAGVLAFILGIQILHPLQQLSRATGRLPENGARELDVVAALNRSVRGLLADVDQTQIELAKSREHLLQSEKMAMVGKLAAGMAHSIRNPFTSIKMRLFSLNRTLDLNPAQKEDFDVISQEIRHVDTIVQNFLEFSRPPKLKMQPVSPSTVVDMALQLLEHRLKAYEVTVTVHRTAPLPDISADPEQLKEVLVNLIVNACEAIGREGRIDIHEQKAVARSLGPVAQLRVVDNGPGMPEGLREKILQPFFTTKEEGTGLGLSIAVRIIAEHGGWLDVASGPDGGAAFTITLPIKEDKGGHDPDHR
ncbi:MAG: ATP-binding protein [Desulfobacteraceae bacterium]|jgi:signal transduction histidine kinase|nr:ATP-binding protein [Desulfobacteraceae bacterium]